MKKEVKKSSKRGKIGGCVAGEGEFENGAGAPGAPGKGPKNFKYINHRALEFQFLFIKTSQLMLCREIIAVCSQIHTKHLIHCVGTT